MITSYLLTILKDLLDTILKPFTYAPEVTLTGPIASAIVNIQGMLTSLAPILPMVALLAVLGIIFTIEGGVFIYKTFQWVIKKIPGIS